jgi:voltage-gated potassium channel
MFQKYKELAYRLLEGPAKGDLVRKGIIAFLFFLISLNVLIVFVETESGLYAAYASILQVITVFSFGFFTVEYLLRLWVCTLNPAYASPVRGRLRYAVSALALFDLIAILPFYIPLAIPFDLRVLRIFRLTRIFTVLKLGRFSNAWDSLTYTVRTRKEELFIAAILIFMTLVVSSTVMFYIENPAQPDKFSSILHTLWWGVVTLSTVGYGDMYPITPLGKLVGGVVALSGIALFALPAGIIAAGLVESLHHRNKEDVGKRGRMDDVCDDEPSLPGVEEDRE